MKQLQCTCIMDKSVCMNVLISLGHVNIWVYMTTILILALSLQNKCTAF